MTVYLGERAGEPVATAVLLVSERIAGIYAVGTVPEFRGHGCGAAMTGVALKGGMARGCGCASLQASGVGYPVYFRMGFRHVFEYQCWWVRSAPTS